MTKDRARKQAVRALAERTGTRYTIAAGQPSVPDDDDGAGENCPECGAGVGYPCTCSGCPDCGADPGYRCTCDDEGGCPECGAGGRNNPYGECTCYPEDEVE